jgi:hypothetical protein
LNSVVDCAVLTVAKSRNLDREQIRGFLSGILHKSRLWNNAWVVTRCKSAKVVDNTANSNVSIVTTLAIVRGQLSHGEDVLPRADQLWEAH